MTEDGGRSNIARTVRTARRMVLASFVVAGLLIAGLGVERQRFLGEHTQFDRQSLQLQALADRVLLLDEQLTAAARLAATTADPAWKQRYEALVPQMDEAIGQAIALATPQAAQHFQAQTAVANNALVELERQALSDAQAGQRAQAQAVLQGETYLALKATLAQGTQALMESLLRVHQQHADEAARRAWMLFGLLVVLAGVGMAALWQRLRRRLDIASQDLTQAQAQLQQLARFDPLTGLANRHQLNEHLLAALARARRREGQVAVLMLDLDHFKPVNDRYGHAAGDQLLVAVAHALQRSLRMQDLAARLGGDEFVLVTEFDANTPAPVLLAERVMAALAVPLPIGAGHTVQVGASLGLALWPQDGNEVHTLLAHADLALYRAKQQGRGQICHFEPAFDTAARERAALQMALGGALQQGALRAHFQPVLRLADGHVDHLETLVRWPHEDGRQRAPAEFLPLVQLAGWMDRLTEQMLAQATRQAQAWGCGVAVNITPQQLQPDLLLPLVHAALRDSGLPPRRLTLEITESAVVADLAMGRATLVALRELGVRIALDDFGTGESRLALLADLPIDVIKIDRSFVSRLGMGERVEPIVALLLDLAARLGLDTVAEGIETQAQADWLRQAGCGYGQGYLYAPALAPARVAEFLARPPALPALPAGHVPACGTRAVGSVPQPPLRQQASELSP